MNVLEDLVVVCPGWVAEVDGWVAWVEFGKKKSTEMQRSCARNCLKRTCTILGESWRIGAQDELCRGSCEACETGDGKIFVI